MNETDVATAPEFRTLLGTAWELGGAGREPDEEVAALFEHAADVFHRRGDCSGAVTAFTRAAELSAAATPAPAATARPPWSAAPSSATCEPPNPCSPAPDRPAPDPPPRPRRPWPTPPW
ncbi:hypothetical protein ACFQ9X_36065 [Catenulispora yoronensis]